MSPWTCSVDIEHTFLECVSVIDTHKFAMPLLHLVPDTILANRNPIPVDQSVYRIAVDDTRGEKSCYRLAILTYKVHA